MRNIPPSQSALTVRLRTDTNARRLEALHRLAWRDLLDLRPGTTQALLDQAASQMGLTAGGLGTGATVGFQGGCGSDLFAVCDACHGDRAVIEIKGPQAPMNLGEVAWQADRYCDAYRADPALACEHLPLPSPLLILLDGRNRTRKIIEERRASTGRSALPTGRCLPARRFCPTARSPTRTWPCGCLASDIPPAEP